MENNLIRVKCFCTKEFYIVRSKGVPYAPVCSVCSEMLNKSIAAIAGRKG